MQMIYGINPVLEAMRIDRDDVEKIIVMKSKSGKPFQGILQMAAQKGIPVEFRDKAYLERMAPRDIHQGIIGLCKAYRYADVDQIIDNRHALMNRDLILMLDSITDPQNLGSLIRTAHCLGANGVIIPEHRAASVNASAVKASAGTAYYIPVAMVDNLANTIESLKTKGFWIYGAHAPAGQDIRTVTFDEKVVLVMGSEGKGIRELVRKKCDFLISVPMLGKIDSLNVSVAAGITIYEILYGRCA
jgi:23S rRNA (guanosine2251-2'-O)-methyltransferase